jgi:hypothetical protein
MIEPRKNAGKTSRPTGRPFQPGNPGRPKGSRHKTTLAVEALLDGEAEGLTRKAVELALAGDMTALRLCLDRICPPRRDRPVAVDLPGIDNPADLVAATAALVNAAAVGDLSPSEAADLGRVLDTHVRAIETHDLEARIARLEKKKDAKQ